MSMEGTPFQGPQAIIEKLTSLPIGRMERAIDTLDVQVSGQGLLLIFVTGRLIVHFFDFRLTMKHKLKDLATCFRF